jgi:glycosyltransferase involved in cell wall biosynthesis
MALKCPVVCSNLAVFKEIYGEAPYYFNPYDVDHILTTIICALKEDKKKREFQIEAGIRIAGRYSWKKCAKLTLMTYESCTRLRSG